MFVGVIWKTVYDVYNLCFSEYPADKCCNKIHKQLKRVWFPLFFIRRNVTMLYFQSCNSKKWRNTIKIRHRWFPCFCEKQKHKNTNLQKKRKRKLYCNFPMTILWRIVELIIVYNCCSGIDDHFSHYSGIRK